MNGNTRWEKAWRAFDADLQSSHDASSLVGRGKSPRKIFKNISDEFDTETYTEDEVTEQVYLTAWNKLRKWIQNNNDASYEDTARKYNDIISELELDDDGWSELRKSV